MAAGEAVGGVVEAVHVRGEDAFGAVDAPGPVEAEAAAVGAVAAAVGEEAVGGDAEGHAALDHLYGDVAVVVHAGGVGVDAVLAGVAAAAADLDLDEDLAGAVGGDGLEGADVGVAVVGGGDAVGDRLGEGAVHGVEQAVGDGDAVGDGGGGAGVHDQALGGDDGDRAVAAGVGGDGLGAAGHDGEHDGAVAAGEGGVDGAAGLGEQPERFTVMVSPVMVRRTWRRMGRSRSTPSSSRKSSNS